MHVKGPSRPAEANPIDSEREIAIRYPKAMQMNCSQAFALIARVPSERLELTFYMLYHWDKRTVRELPLEGLGYLWDLCREHPSWTLREVVDYASDLSHH